MAAVIRVAAKANPSLVLPTLALVALNHQQGQLKGSEKTIIDDKILSGGNSVQLSCGNDKSTDMEALQYLAKVANIHHTPYRLSLSLEWISRSQELAAASFQSIHGQLQELNTHLLLRTYIVGYDINAGDVAVWAVLHGNHVALSWIRKANNNITRWYNYIEQANGWIAESLSEILHASANEKIAARASASSAGASYEIELPNIDAPIVTRFPPEPSGYLHIGHAKAALLNAYYADLRPGGKLICRFDDTNPEKETMEFQDAIMEDIGLLGIKPDVITYSSDYFDQMYHLAIQLINSGKAFADDKKSGKGEIDKRNRLPSLRRDMSIDETLARFEDMKNGSDDGRWALRARIAYDSPNGTLRDPVIYRSNKTTPHHRTGTKWTIYPTYDFCAPVLDSIEGVTLALRTNEYRDRNAQYEWMQDALGLRKVPIWDFSRLNFVRTVLSKRKLALFVQQGKVTGWDDPRMPTIRGLLRRGVTLSALREYIIKQGPSRNILNLDWGAFWALNRKHIDLQAPRHTAIALTNAVVCQIRGSFINGVEEKPQHNKNPSLGLKTIMYNHSILLEQADAAILKIGEEITLMNWGNVVVKEVSTCKEDGTIDGIVFALNPGGNVKTTQKKLTWLANQVPNLVAVELVSFDYLITKDKLEKQDKLEDFMTPATEFRTAAFADCNITQLKQGSIIQFERKGFYRLDETCASQIIFFEIPTK